MLLHFDSVLTNMQVRAWPLQSLLDQRQPSCELHEIREFIEEQDRAIPRHRPAINIINSSSFELSVAGEAEESSA